MPKAYATILPMDLHPLFVHFPIALLTVYSFFEVIRRFTKGPQWVTVRAVLVIAGTIGAFVSLQTGESAERLFQDSEFRNVLETHAFLATTVTWIYAFLAATYIAGWLERTSRKKVLPKTAETLVTHLWQFVSIIHRSPIPPILAIVGFLGLTVVGGLGAILVYGPDFDPMTSLLYRLLFQGRKPRQLVSKDIAKRGVLR